MMQRMTTARALLFSTILIAAAIIGAAWFTTKQINPGNRYQITNTGSGSTVRLDRQTGDMIRCHGTRCVPVVKGGKIMAVKDEWPGHDATDDIPPPLPGFTMDVPPHPPVIS